MLAGIPVPPPAVADLASMVRAIGADELADRLEQAVATEVKVLAMFSALGTDTTLAMRERARQRATWIVDNCFATRTGISLGPVVHDAPAALAPAEGTLELLVRGVHGGVHRKSWTSKGWSPSPTGSTSVGGEVIGVPAAVSWSRDRLDVFAAGHNRRIYHRFRTAGTWAPDSTDANQWEDLDGATTIAPRGRLLG